VRYEPKVKHGIGECVICHKVKPLVCDHDHETGYNRDGLCGNCNTGLGMFCDSPAVMRRAARYVERHRALNRELTIKKHELPSMRQH
jgi:recombination endonuclease VII